MVLTPCSESSAAGSAARYLPYIKSLKSNVYAFLQAYANEATLLQQREKDKEKGLNTAATMSLNAYLNFRIHHFGMRFLCDVMFIIMLDTDGYFDDKMPATVYEGLCKAVSSVG